MGMLDVGANASEIEILTNAGVQISTDHLHTDMLDF